MSRAHALFAPGPEFEHWHHMTPFTITTGDGSGSFQGLAMMVDMIASTTAGPE